ncbi:MAG TPA: AMP-binding protein, partial [Dehalococcoidia bacterium]|nr:AMP-binding protein [Dehalococcoidia bacterium]
MDDTFPKLLASSPTRFGARKVAFREKNLGIWSQSTWQEYADRVRLASLGLMELGLQRGDRFALIGSNKRELFVLALAAQATGATIVGVFQDETPREVRSVLTQTGAALVLAEDQEQVDKLLSIKASVPQVRRVIYLEGRGMEYYDDALLLPFDQLIELGRGLLERSPDAFEANLALGSEGDPAVIAYSSGLTGEPRPVVLTYRNLLKLAEAWRSIDAFRPNDEYVSFVAPASISELLVTLALHLTTGFIVNFPESDSTILEDLKEIGPHLVVAPNRFWETIVGTMRMKAQETSNLKRSAVNANLPSAERAAEARLKRGGPAARPGGLGNFLVFRPMRDSVGLLRTRLAFNVGGSLSPEAVTTLHAIGVPIRQIYGLTECGGIATMHRPDDIRLETVGQPFPEAEVQVAANGEILLRGPSVFSGYFNETGATAEVLRDGWLHTGDAGFLTEDNHLVVIDRLPAVLNLPDGTRFSAQSIETRLKLSPYIAEAVVIGQN